MEKITTLNAKIDTNQSKLDEQKLEYYVLKSFKSINNLAQQQDSLQQSIFKTNNPLGVLSTLLTTLVDKETNTPAGGPASPIQKNRKTDNPGATEPPGVSAMEVELT
jgi:hypothetical protein